MHLHRFLTFLAMIVHACLHFSLQYAKEDVLTLMPHILMSLAHISENTFKDFQTVAGSAALIECYRQASKQSISPYVSVGPITKAWGVWPILKALPASD